MLTTFLPDFGEHSLLVYILIVCTIFALISILFPKPVFTEGFQQREHYLVGQPYDSFYAEHYDIIQDTESRCQTELAMILPYLDSANTHVLDVGCGTGCLLKMLEDAGVPCTGIDKAPEMTALCPSSANVVTGNALEPLTFQPGSFTHILCLHHTIYEVENPDKLLAVCKGWLQVGGVLVIHVVEKDRFNMVAPCGATSLIPNPQVHVDQRIRKSKVDFIDYLYESDYTTDAEVVVETFTDGATGHIRQYEKPVRLDTDVATLAAKNGFKLLEKKPLPSDQHQWLYFYRVT
jgi:SAM-dependent methyltransferase